jgi:hypothetical protein
MGNLFRNGTKAGIEIKVPRNFHPDRPSFTASAPVAAQHVLLNRCETAAAAAAAAGGTYEQL